MKRRILVPAAIAALCLTATAAALPRAPRVECDHPRALRLVRYEDGSARLYCGLRLLVKVSVPY